MRHALYTIATIIASAPLLPAAAAAQDSPVTYVPRTDTAETSAESIASAAEVLRETDSNSEKFLKERWLANDKTVIYTASRRYQNIQDTGNTAYVLTEQDISSHGWRSLSELLRHIPGVQTIVSESQMQSVSIRGMAGLPNSPNILWLSDGHPINERLTGGVYLDETWPVESIKRIEIVIGPVSSLYGSGAFQGVIQIFTKSARDMDKYGEYRIGLQDHLTFKGAASYGHTTEGGVGLLGSVSGGTSQGPGLIGDYIYNQYVMKAASDNVTNGSSPTQFREGMLDNSSDRHWYNLGFKVDYQKFALNIHFKDVYTAMDGSEYHPTLSFSANANKDKDSESASKDDNSNTKPSGIGTGTVGLSNPYRMHRMRLDISADKTFDISSIFSLKTGVSYILAYDKLENFLGISSIDNSSMNFSPMQHQAYANIQADIAPIPTNYIAAGIDFKYSSIDTSLVTNDAKNSIDFGVYLRDEQHLWNDRIVLAASIRYDAVRILDSLSSEVSANASFNAFWTPWFATRLSYGYGFNLPSASALYFDKSNYGLEAGLPTSPIFANNKLHEETMHSIELDLNFLIAEKMNLQFNLFTSILRDALTWSYNNSFIGIAESTNPTIQYAQIAVQDYNAVIFGAEAIYNVIFANNFGLSASYSFLYSMIDHINQTATSAIPSRASSFANDTMHRFKLDFSYSGDRIAADLAIFAVGGHPETESMYPWNVSVTDGNQSEKVLNSATAYVLLQPSVAVALPVNLGLSLTGTYAFSKGMFDSPTYRYYYETEGVPVSRYSIMLSLMYPFKK